jgi:hypothetical protein
MHDIRVTVYDGKFHPVDSKDIAFATAGRKAFIDAVEKARPVLLEPIVKIRITAKAARWATSPATSPAAAAASTAATARAAAGSSSRARSRSRSSTATTHA